MKSRVFCCLKTSIFQSNLKTHRENAKFRMPKTNFFSREKPASIEKNFGGKFSFLNGNFFSRLRPLFAVEIHMGERQNSFNKNRQKTKGFYYIDANKK